jgi:hypothetical protein
VAPAIKGLRTAIAGQPAQMVATTFPDGTPRRGHQTRLIKFDLLGPTAGKDVRELSFPALEGASGAPVMFESVPTLNQEWAWGIVGVLASNIGYHAIPAQMITVEDDRNRTVKESYMLPQGLAVNIKHLRLMYEGAIGT